MDKFLSEQDLPRFYELMNKAQRQATQPQRNDDKIDLFVILDISGSMNQSTNKILNHGAGYVLNGVVNVGGRLINRIAKHFTGGQIINMEHEIVQRLFNTRLGEAKRHLKYQILDLIRQNRINKLGLITFNNQAKVQINLTSKFRSVLRRIADQQAFGATALYDSILFAENQLKNSQNPRMLIMTDGEDNSSRQKRNWMQGWFQKSGLKSTFFTICQGDNEKNREFASQLHAKYINAGVQHWFNNSFDGSAMDEGFEHLIKSSTQRLTEQSQSRQKYKDRMRMKQKLRQNRMRMYQQQYQQQQQRQKFLNRMGISCDQ